MHKTKNKKYLEYNNRFGREFGLGLGWFLVVK
jgi:hypothetical protein